MTDLDPSAYAPYRDPRDYILSWTDAIWEAHSAGGFISSHRVFKTGMRTGY